MTLFLLILGAVFLVLFVSAVYTFYVACARRKDVNWLVEEEVTKTAYKNYYSIILDAKRWLDDHGAQDISITSEDGLRLHGLWVPVENPKGTILLAHGYRSTVLVDFGSVLEIYHRLGFQLLLPDQRSHGQSQGKYITFGVKESGDMLGWIKYHNRKFGEHPMILSGLSMGASTMMYLADQELPHNVKGMIVDCGFTSPKEIISSVFRSVTHLPAGPTILMTELLARSIAGFSLWQKDSRKTLSKNRLPILMIHGREDTFVPCKMTEQGYAACTGPKRLLIVDGAEHGVSFLIDTKTYIETVMSFLRDNLEEFE